MKLFWKSLPIFWLISLICTACAAPASTADPAGTGGSNLSSKIVIALDAKWPPFASPGAKSNEWTGFDVELMQAIAAKARLDLTFVDGGFNLITLVSNCQAGAGISIIPISENLKKRVVFSEPYYTAGQVVVVKQGNLEINGRENLSGRIVGTEVGSSGETAIGAIRGAVVKSYATYNLAFQDLIDGNIEAVITDKPHALVFVNVKRNQLMIVGDEFSSVQYGIAVCRNRPELVLQINNSLATLKADGTLNRLISKWITENDQ